MLFILSPPSWPAIDALVIYVRAAAFHLAEVQLFDQGSSRISRDRLTFASFVAGDPELAGSSCNDGDLSTWCTSSSSLTILIIGEPIAVSQIAIWNRQDCCQDVIDGVLIAAHSNGVVVWSRLVPTTSAPLYSFSLPLPPTQPATGPAGRN